MIGRRPVQRLAITIGVLVSLLFAQLALASYVCPSERAQGGQRAAMQMAPGQPCEGMGMAQDQEQPVLCHDHCQNAPQSFDPLHVPAVSLPAIVQVLVVPLLLDPVGAASAVHARLAPQRPPPEPLFLATLRLRV